MRIVRHPLVEQDLAALVDHIIDVTSGDFDAAARRLDEVDDLIADISSNPMSGVRLAPPLDGWLVRHGGRGHRLTAVFRADLNRNCVFVALVAFGGQDWMTEGETRKSFGG
ncbi:MAG: type II toxin-antitoxin system RelE/ParE family toxin [Hyphomonas sp.]|jgi:plasmid stabilization system protein ParE|nr:type II toxin-antitoxin system RelE/ParE family toxin [Hyphomonas sp.]